MISHIDARLRILATFSDDSLGWHYGHDMMKACKLRAGKFYTVLDRMEDEGVIEAKWENDDGPSPRRRMYRLKRS